MPYEMDGVRLHFTRLGWASKRGASFICTRCNWRRDHVVGDRMTELSLRYHESRCPQRWRARMGWLYVPATILSVAEGTRWGAIPMVIAIVLLLFPEVWHLLGREPVIIEPPRATPRRTE